MRVLVELMSFDPGDWGHMGGWGWWGMLLMWTVVVGAAALVIVGTRSRQEPRPSRPTAVEILDERYARGEIDHEEYRQRRSELGHA